MSAATLHEAYRLLRECGEDAECSCGCGGKVDPKTGKKVLLEPEKKVERKKRTEAVEELRNVLDEVRRKIGLKQFRYIKKVSTPRKAKGARMKMLWRAKSAVRSSAANNRHRISR